MQLNKSQHFLWLGGIFDEETINEFPAISPASNFWQRGFVEALQAQGCRVDVIGHPVERVWPFGRLGILARYASLPQGLTGRSVGYMNAPYLRGITQYVNYLRGTSRLLKSFTCQPDCLVTFSCLSKATAWASANSAARFIRKRFGIPWICIVADGVAPPGADGYVYLTWSYFESSVAPSPKIHIDGGVPAIQLAPKPYAAPGRPRRPRVLMYMGALTPHGGSSWLARVFHQLPDQDIELWICGRGENAELQRLAEVDGRIRLVGFVGESELNELASQADAFANPRPGDFEPNKLNYPSKVLHYLAYGKPVISTFTDGISPEYRDVLVPIADETDACMAEAIRNVLNMEESEYAETRRRVENFNSTHSWAHQAQRFIAWLSDSARH